MKTKETHISPDGALKLMVVEADDGTIAVGFDGGVWHSHPDLIADWLSVAEQDAVQALVDAILRDQLPILLKASSGDMSDAWISDNLLESLRVYGDDEWSFRLWSGTTIDSEQAREAYAEIVRGDAPLRLRPGKSAAR